MWYKAPGNAPECLFPGASGEQLWVAVQFTSDGDVSPSLSQLRLDFQYERLAAHLPDCYFEDVPNRGLVSRLVGLFAGFYEDVDGAIDRLPARLDPQATPAENVAALAALVGLEPGAGSTTSQLREAIGRAFSLHDQRGTTRGLVEAIRSELGIRVVVEEPIHQARCWVLPGDGPTPEPDGANGIGSILGVTTALAAGEPQGAVVGSSLTLDQTQLIDDQEIGLPIFGELAHRLIVRVYQRAAQVPNSSSPSRTCSTARFPAMSITGSARSSLGCDWASRLAWVSIPSWRDPLRRPQLTHRRPVRFLSWVGNPPLSWAQTATLGGQHTLVSLPLKLFHQRTHHDRIPEPDARDSGPPPAGPQDPGSKSLVL